MKKILLLISIVLISNNLYSQKPQADQPSDWKFTGLAHMISQMDGKDFSNHTHPLFYNVMKFRVGVEKTLFGQVDFKLEIQDSRLMGQEAGVTNNDHNLDLFQGYVNIRDLFELPLSLQLGRFQMQYGTERIIGRSFWHMNERVFDGLRFKYHTKAFKADFFNIIHTNSTDYILKLNPGTYQYPAADSYGYGVYGLWTQTQISEKSKIDVFGIMEADDHLNETENVELVRNTFGLNYFGNYGSLSTILEFAYQIGNKKGDNFDDDGNIKSSYDKDINAYMAALRLDYKMKPVKLALGGNIISGTDPADGSEINTYSNYLASKHKFFGLMDYFLDIKNGTGNLGLNDIYIGVSYPEIVKNLSASLTAHYFMSNQSKIFMIDDIEEELSDFGQEIDLTFDYKIIKGTSVKFGGGLFMPGGLMKELWKLEDGTERSDMSFWAFAMLVTRL